MYHAAISDVGAGAEIACFAFYFFVSDALVARKILGFCKKKLKYLLEVSYELTDCQTTLL